MYKPSEVFVTGSSEAAYVQALVACILRACGCEVDQVGSTDSNNYFMRDHFTLTALDMAMITSKKTRDIGTIANTIAPILPHMHNPVAIESEFFGGNTFQVVHGDSNTIYFADDKVGLMSAPSFFAPTTLVSPKAIINELNAMKTNGEHALARTKFKALALQSNDEKHKAIWQKYYYHLDCFMLFVPNGKVILLNGKMLKEGAYRDLVYTVGKDNIIDLEHDYLNDPVLFNMVVIPLPNNKYMLLGPSLPDNLLDNLESFGYYVVTPESINSAHTRFNAELAALVSQYLREAGWNADEKTLVSRTPGYRTEYPLKNLRFIAAMLTSVKNAEILMKLVTGVLRLDQIKLEATKSERVLFMQLIGQFIPRFGGTKTILTSGSEKERIKYCLQILCESDKAISFDFTKLDAHPSIPESIPFLSLPGSETNISLICEKGSVHCLLQEYPTIVDGKMQLFSPTKPLFKPRNDYGLLRRYQGADPRPPTIDTVLRRAAGRGNVIDIAIAIEAGADVNAQDARRGFTALHWACLNGHTDVICQLLRNGADSSITAKFPEPYTPFDLLSIELSELEQALTSTNYAAKAG